MSASQLPSDARPQDIDTLHAVHRRLLADQMVRNARRARGPMAPGDLPASASDVTSAADTEIHLRALRCTSQAPIPEPLRDTGAVFRAVGQVEVRLARGVHAAEAEESHGRPVLTKRGIPVSAEDLFLPGEVGKHLEAARPDLAGPASGRRWDATVARVMRDLHHMAGQGEFLSAYRERMSFLLVDQPDGPVNDAAAWEVVHAACEPALAGVADEMLEEDGRRMRHREAQATGIDAVAGSMTPELLRRRGALALIWADNVKDAAPPFVHARAIHVVDHVAETPVVSPVQPVASAPSPAMQPLVRKRRGIGR